MKKRILSRLHIDPRRMHVSLSTAWIMGIGLAFLGIVAVTLAALGFFVGVFDDEPVVSEEVVEAENISRADLSRAAELIGARLRDFERLKTTAPELADPSL